MASLVEDFLTEAQQMVGQFHSSALAGDIESARRAAHLLKSTSLMFGAVSLAQTCMLVEKEADHYASAQFKELSAKLDVDFESVKKALQAWLAENSLA
jgi:HPt (histidine-containing phosphotransfer) domain-containing protein